MEIKKQVVSMNTSDRISELSDELIHHIFYMLDIQTVVQTSVLSRRWRYLWCYLPNIVLHDVPFIEAGVEYFVTLNRFVNFVDRLLYLRDKTTDIQTLDLTWHTAKLHLDVIRYDITNRIMTWILAAMKQNLQELHLFIFTYQTIQLPDCFFTCKSLTKLVLSGAGMEHTGFALPKSTMHFPRLRYLELNGVSLSDKNLTSKLFSSCPVLESLLLTDCNVSFDISSLSLKYFKLDNHYEHGESYVNTVKLCAPNLISFDWEDYMSQDCSLENLSSLVTADIGMSMIDIKDYEPEAWKIISELATEVRELYAVRMTNVLRAVCNVKHLRLSSPGFFEIVSGSLNLLGSQHYFQFHNLRSLKVLTWVSRNCLNAISYLVEMSPNIKSLCMCIVKTEFNSTNTGQDWVAASSFPCLQHLKIVEIQGLQRIKDALMNSSF